ncbi:MAG: GWxTD domain-containing protein [Gemmatimonadota bacterium]
MTSNRRRGGAWLALAVLAMCFPSDAMPQGAAERDDAPESAVDEERAPAFEVSLFRTWTGEDLTIVDGLAQVPLAMMAGGTTGAYRFELTVLDAEGTQLYRDSWERNLSNRAVAYTDAEASTMLEAFRFGVRPGAYEVEIRAYPTDAPSVGARSVLDVAAYDERPVASDLFLADRVEPLDEEAGGSWSITHGGFGIAAVARATVVPQEPRLFYYVEVYGEPELASAVELTASVVGADDQVLYTTPARTEQVPIGGLPVAGSLSLAGLPPGAYELRLELVDEDGDATTREAEFRMLDVESSVPAASASYEASYFESLSDDELDDTFGGVAYLVSESERQVYNALPHDARRRYLAEFFASRNPTVGGMGNPFLEEYIDRVGTVRMKYGELVGTGERPPWTTEAGRLFLRYGEPDERVINHFPSGSDTRPAGGLVSMQGEVPYEIWSYHSTGWVYLFVAETQFGNWRMIFTNDPNMRSLADWQDRVGGEALRELSTRFGIQPRF